MDELFLSKQPFGDDELSKSWVACMYPDLQHLLNAHTEFYHSLLEKPASARGFSRWGLKDVRLDVNHAFYLKWLYPKSKMVFQVRNPIDSWKSYKGNDWVWEHHRLRIYSAKQFAHMWNHLADGFLRFADELGAMVVRYEDLTSDTDETIAKLEGYLDLKLDPDVLQDKVTGNTVSGSMKEPATPSEIASIKKITKSAAAKLGYF